MGAEGRLRLIIHEQKAGNPVGIYSVCSANRYVIEAAILQGMEDESVVLVESTCNQVNQFGGYTGMTPHDFNQFVLSTGKRLGLPPENLILGGDHLGPYPFREDGYDSAMDKTGEMIKAFVRAGCGKIHLDTSYRLSDDTGTADTPLAPPVIAERCAMLCVEAEKSFEECLRTDDQLTPPVYVIGTEVPAPGGSENREPYENITTVQDFEETIKLTEAAFRKYGIESAWDRVIAVVVEPGVEHGDQTVLEYNREKTRDLSSAIRKYEGYVYEAHTTDYQTVHSLKRMVEDGFAILKTGQSQTNAAKEAVFMLNSMEEEILRFNSNVKPSQFRETLDHAMLSNPGHWQGYYQDQKSSFQRQYSFYDRQRYYWSDQNVSKSLQLLLSNLRAVDIPLSLLSQFMPEQYRKFREGVITSDPEDLIRDKIMDHMREYAYAVGNRNVLFE